jgi:phage shock protein PspC (stress-responsive transcriptional regulator)
MDNTKALNIGQRVFLFNTDAYEKFTLYQKMIHSHFKRYDNFEQKIEDIEFKIADLFDLSLKNKESLTFEDVESVIDKMGLSADWDKIYDSPAAEGSSSNSNRRLFRSTSDSIIAGICGGLAAYFKTEAIYIRIAAIVLFPASFLVYIIFWFVTPTDIDLESKHLIRNQERLKSAAAKSGEFFTKLIGIILIVVSLIMILLIYIGLTQAYYALDLNTISVNIIEPGSQRFLVGSFIVAIFGPFIFLFMLSIRLIIDTPYPKYTWMTAFLIWLGSIVGIFFYGSKVAMEFHEHASIKNSITMPMFTDSLLIINTEFTTNDAEINFLVPEVRLYSKDVKEVSCKILYTSYGSSPESAKSNARNIEYTPRFVNNVMHLPSRINLEKHPYFRDQRVEIFIYVPRHLPVHIENFTRDIFFIGRDQEFAPKFQSEIHLIPARNGFKISE